LGQKLQTEHKWGHDIMQCTLIAFVCLICLFCFSFWPVRGFFQYYFQ